jgi:hypothetical protein
LPDIQAIRSNDMDRLAIAACFGVEMELFAVLAPCQLPFFLASLEHEPLREVAKRVGINSSLPEADMATPITTVSVVEEGGYSTVSWGAVLAGGIAAAAVTLVLLARSASG